MSSVDGGTTDEVTGAGGGRDDTARDEALSRLVRRTRELFGAAACSLGLLADDDRLAFVVADGMGAAEIVGRVLPLGQGIAGWAVMTGQAVAVRDAASDPRFSREVAESTGYVPSHIMAAPVVDAEGSRLGVLELLDPRPLSEDSGRDLAVLGLVAADAAEVIVLSGTVRDPDDEPLSSRERQLVERVSAVVVDWARDVR